MIFYRFITQTEIFVLHPGDCHWWYLHAYQTQAYGACSFSIAAPTPGSGIPCHWTLKIRNLCLSLKRSSKHFHLVNFTCSLITLFFSLCILFIFYICKFICIFLIFYFLHLLSALRLCSCALKEFYSSSSSSSYYYYYYYYYYSIRIEEEQRNFGISINQLGHHLPQRLHHEGQTMPTLSYLEYRSSYMVLSILLRCYPGSKI